MGSGDSTFLSRQLYRRFRDQVGHVTTLQHVHVKLLSPVPGCMCHCEGYYTILGVMVRTKGVEDL